MIGYPEVDGYIVIETKYNPHTTRVETYKVTWEGGPVVEVSMDLVSQGQADGLVRLGPGRDLTIGGYRLKFLCDRPEVRSSVYIGKHYRLYPFIVWAYHLGWYPTLIKSRVITTLAVWGLAYRDVSGIPRWDEVYFIRRVRAWWRRVR